MARKALLVGLNSYPDPFNSLRGCVNDVTQLRGLLESRLGFDRRDVESLFDSAATTAAIVARLQRMVERASSGDVLIFHYSGHGSQVADVHGDELDDLDEIICPYDLDWRHPFTDDDLYGIVRKLPVGAHLTVILDCCHSGTGLREWTADARDRARFIAPPPSGAELRLRAMRRFGARAAQGGAVLLAACRSDQVAADAEIDGDYHGAFTYFFCRALEETECSGSYTDLLHRVRRSLARNGFGQVPQLEGPLDLLKHTVFSAPVESPVG